MEFEKDFYIMKALTNMHVGSGEISLSIVDNTVQKDPVRETPVIHSSSLKGALREYMEQEKCERAGLVEWIFGSKPFADKADAKAGEDKNSPDNDRKKKQSIQGKYRFFNAHLLAIPVRSNIRPFFMATSLEILENLTDVCGTFEIRLKNKENENIKRLYELLSSSGIPEKNRPLIIGKKQVYEKTTPIYLEDYEADFKEDIHDDTIGVLTTLIHPHLALFHDDDLKDLCKNLPVIARNQLENGESKNLWYEEIVPHETLFYTIMLKTIGDDKNRDYSFDTKVIQIGSGATIGYGYTQFNRLECEAGRKKGSDES